MNLLITGNTYPQKRLLRSLGGVWNVDNKGWIIPLGSRSKIENISDIHIQEIEIEIKHLRGEELRKYRQNKLDRKSKLYAERAEKLREKSGEMYDKASKMASIIPMGQPILIGHHSERYHRNYLKKIDNKMRKGVEMEDKAIEYERKSNPLPARIAGDAEREKETKRKLLLSKIKIGDLLESYWFGKCKISKIFKKSVKVILIEKENKEMTLNLLDFRTPSQ